MILPDGRPRLGLLNWQSQPIGIDLATGAGGPRPATAGQDLMKALALVAASGLEPRVSPFRELVLVHAVQRPLCDPVLARVVPVPEGQSTGVALFMLGLTHAASTGKVDLLADWKEWIDDPRDAGPKRVGGNAHLCEQAVSQDAPSNELDFGCHHDFGDTKYRSVNYRLRATTAFREYFPAAVTTDPKDLSREGPMLQVDIPSRARPAAPRVLYTVPTFGWDRTTAPGDNGTTTITSRRRGGGLRVYLDRPWYSSGDGELLGVVLPLKGAPAVGSADPRKHLVTQFGHDPAWPPPVGLAGNPPGNRLTVGAFRATEAPASNLTLGSSLTLDEAKLLVDVVGYPVYFDDQRRLWYADVQIDNPDAYYWPFVRLALARYQPRSFPGFELSRVVLADFAQLLPDRTVTVRGVSAAGRTLTVTVDNYDRMGDFASQSETVLGTSADQRHLIEVGLEAADPTNSDPDLGWLPAQGVGVKILDDSATPKGSRGVGTFQWQITTPDPNGVGKYRLIVKEYEAQFNGGKDRRLVYADTIRLDHTGDVKFA